MALRSLLDATGSTKTGTVLKTTGFNKVSVQAVLTQTTKATLLVEGSLHSSTGPWAVLNTSTYNNGTIRGFSTLAPCPLLRLRMTARTTSASTSVEKVTGLIQTV